MSESVMPGVWRGAAQSVIGSSHTRSGKPNQDALGFWPESHAGPNVVLVIADGHGSAKSFRSDRGSRFAVEVAQAALREMVAATASLPEIKRMAEEKLPGVLVREWRRKVDDDLANEPLTDEDWSLLGGRSGDADDQSGKSMRRFVAYGSTLLAVAATSQYILLMQLGDGDMLFVTKAGAVTRPMPSDSRLFANETTSLSSEDAAKNFRIEFSVRQRPDEAFSGLILVATDGYANSYPDDASFLKVGSDMLSLVVEYGLENVQTKLESWLEQVSAGGSGDDVTVGLLVQDPKFDAPKDEEQNRETDQDASTMPPPADPLPILANRGLPEPAASANQPSPSPGVVRPATLPDTSGDSGSKAPARPAQGASLRSEQGLSLMGSVVVPVWLTILVPICALVLGMFVTHWLGIHGRKSPTPSLHAGSDGHHGTPHHPDVAPNHGIAPPTAPDSGQDLSQSSTIAPHAPPSENS